MRTLVGLAGLLAILSAAAPSRAQTAPSEPPAVTPGLLPATPIPDFEPSLPAIGTGVPMPLDEVLTTIDARHPLLVAALKDQEVAEGELLAAKGGFDPIWRTRALFVPVGFYDTARVDTLVVQPTPVLGASFFAGYRLGLGDFAVYDLKAKTLDQGELRAGVAVPLLRDLTIDPRRAALWSARLGPEIAKANYAAQRLELIRAASVRYWNWVEAGRAVAIARELLALAELRDGALKERVTKGDIADLERQDNLRTVVSRRATLVAVERQFIAASLELSLFLRDANGKTITPSAARVPPSFPEPKAPFLGSVDGEIAKALAKRPELARIETQKEQVSIEKRLAKNQTYPALDFQTVASRDFGAGPEYLRPMEVEVGLVLDVPILARVANGKLEAATAKGEKLDAQRAFVADRIKADVRDVVAAEAAARSRIALARAELSLARKLAEAERESFSLGSSTILVVNLREQAVAEAALKEAAALADWHKAYAAYRVVTASI